MGSRSPRDMNDYKRVRDQGDKRLRRAKLLANLHLNGTTYPAARETERRRGSAACVIISRAIRYRRRQKERRYR